ncbi:MAG: glycoside hydrolase family 127 protein [Deinococcales bacterium]
MDYPIQALGFNKVEIADRFWQQRQSVNRKVTIPINFKKCEETGRVDNFLKAAGKMEGPHTGLFFNDSDVYKVMEGACYTLSLHPDPDLEAYLDQLINIITEAQEPDGYLYTARTINPSAVRPHIEGPSRWSNLKVNHELYNVGHMYEAAAAHYLATGKQNFLRLALHNAELIDSVFGSNKHQDVPGHQEIELGLVKLYRITGEERYLKLAKFFLDGRGHHDTREQYDQFGVYGYSQDHLPVTEQNEAVGHSVRAVYMYAAMADVAALTGDQTYIKALDRIWENVVSKKIYLTAGIGARHQGESFGDNYDLPNASAYNETCAAIANIFWNQRMFLLHGEAKYHDIIERTLYNGFLSGVSLDGDSYFYVNPLEADGHYAFNRDGAKTRKPWFECSCCPPNIARLLASLSGYIYALKDDVLYVNQYISSSTEADLSGTKLALRQESQFPWQGDVSLSFKLDRPKAFKLALRIPCWAQGQPLPSDLYHYADQDVNDAKSEISLSLNGEALSFELDKGYALIERTWQTDDMLQLHIPMPIRHVLSHEAVQANRGKVAIERGPVVFCAEGIDHSGSALGLSLADTTELQPVFAMDLLAGVMTIQGDGLKLIPYYAWSHRDEGEMLVWLQRKS